MKRKITAWLLLLALVLSGCASQEPDPHPEWSADWFRFYGDLAVEHPEGFTLNESNDVMSIAGLYYATWTAGEARSITNAQGSSAKVYDAQIYVLVKRCETTAEAEADLAAWMEREKASYETGEESPVTAAGQGFTLLPLLQAQEGNPYRRGLAAFALHGSEAISVELLCAEDWQQDPQAVMTAFLGGFHYGH